MKEPTELEKQQYERFKELFKLGQQRYLDAGGDPRRRPSGLKDDDYLTEAERQEFFTLGRKIFGVTIKNGYGYCQGRSWKLPENSPLLKEQVEAETSKL